jgi:hypothetical protein
MVGITPQTMLRCSSWSEVEVIMNEPLKQRTQERQQLLASFGVITEQELASPLGVATKTLKNRDPRDLPAFSKGGNQRLFFRDDVLKYLRRCTND